MNAPPMKVISILVMLAAIFAGGFAAGILYEHHATPLFTGGHEGHRGREHDATHFVDHFRQRLNLTDEQAANVKDVLDDLHKEMEEFHDRFAALRSQVWTDIRATLSEEQQSEFDKLVEELEQRHGHH